MYGRMKNMKLAASSGKVSNGLSRCHTKRRMDAHGRVHPTFGMTPTFQKKKKKKKFGVIPKEGWV